MRRIRLGLAVLGLLAAASAAQAQHSAALMNEVCGGNPCGAPVCCPPLFPGLVEGFHDALGGLFCNPGLNARHSIYRAALCRNDFGKCSKWVPFYSCRTACCGGVNPACPHCSPAAGVGEQEVIPMQDVPAAAPLEPTPAVEPEAAPAVVPEAVAPQSSRARSMQAPQRSALYRAPTPAARTSRDRVARAEVHDESPTPVIRTSAVQPAKRMSLIERTIQLNQQ